MNMSSAVNGEWLSLLSYQAKKVLKQAFCVVVLPNLLHMFLISDLLVGHHSQQLNHHWTREVAIIELGMLQLSLHSIHMQC